MPLGGPHRGRMRTSGGDGGRRADAIITTRSGRIAKDGSTRAAATADDPRNGRVDLWLLLREPSLVDIIPDSLDVWHATGVASVRRGSSIG